MTFNRKTILHYLFLYLSIASNGAILYSVNRNIIVTIMFIIVAIAIASNKIKIEKSFFEYILILFFSLFLTLIYTGGSLSIKSIMNYIFVFFIGYLTYKIDPEKAIFRYVNITTVISTISLIGFFFSSVFGNGTIKILFHSSYLYPNYYYNLLYAFSTGTHYNRNIGIFDEPGAYQFILCMGLLFLLFRLDDKSPKYRFFSILSIVLSLITAQSTTGYFNLIVILLLFLIDFGTRHDKLKKQIRLIFICIVTLVTLSIFTLGNDSLFYNSFINKITNSTGEFDLSANTGKSRVESIKADLSIALENPMGLGFEKYQNVWKSYLDEYIADSSSTSGLTINLATIGFFSTILIMGFILIKCWRGRKTNLEFIVLSFIVFNTMLSQPQTISTILVMFALCSTNIKNLNDNEIGDK